MCTSPIVRERKSQSQGHTGGASIQVQCVGPLTSVCCGTLLLGGTKVSWSLPFFRLQGLSLVSASAAETLRLVEMMKRHLENWITWRSL